MEAYTSATALIRDTKRAMQANKGTKMREIGSFDNVIGKTAFGYKDFGDSARKVVEDYIEKLGVGIANIANEFRTEAVFLGGVCAQGDNLIKPLQEFVNIVYNVNGKEETIKLEELESSTLFSNGAPKQRAGHKTCFLFWLFLFGFMPLLHLRTK